MSDPKDDDIPSDATWGVHLRAIRRDMTFLVDHQRRFMEHVGRLNAQMVNLQSDLLLLETRTILVTAKC